MPDAISAQILTQASENIQKLFDLSTRIDERVRGISIKQEQLEKSIDDINQKHNELNRKIAIAETLIVSSKEILCEFKTLNDEITDLDKRLSKLEREQGAFDERWKSIATFILQLAWAILAAYLLTKFNLQSPAVP